MCVCVCVCVCVCEGALRQIGAVVRSEELLLSGFGTALLLFLLCQLTNNRALTLVPLPQSVCGAETTLCVVLELMQARSSCPVDSWQKHFGIQILCAMQAVAIWKQLEENRREFLKKTETHQWLKPPASCTNFFFSGLSLLNPSFSRRNWQQQQQQRLRRPITKLGGARPLQRPPFSCSPN